jgi:hypothetical protein
MIAVGVVALFLGSIGPSRQLFRRWSYHRGQAAWLGRMEQRELLRAERERILSTDRDAIKLTLLNSPDFPGKNPEDQEKIIDATVMFHRSESKEAQRAAEEWREKRRLEETASWWCWDPFAPDVP